MNKKKFLALMLTIVIVALAVTACSGGANSSSTDGSAASSPEESTGSTPEESKDSSGKEVLVMATEATFPPYEYMDGLDVVGIDVEIAGEIAKELGLELRVETMSFDAVIPAVNSGKADFGAAGMSITEDRLKEVDFSIEYATSTQVIVTTKDSGIAGEDDLAGKTVGVQMGTVSDLVLTDDYPDINLVRVKKYTDAAMDLANGNIDAIVMDILPAQEMAKSNDTFTILEKKMFSDVYAICVKKDNTDMLNTINTVLQRLKDEGKIDEFTLKHTS